MLSENVGASFYRKTDGSQYLRKPSRRVPPTKKAGRLYANQAGQYIYCRKQVSAHRFGFFQR